MSFRIREFTDGDPDALLALHLSQQFRHSKIREVDEAALLAFQQRRFSHLLSLSTRRDDLLTLSSERDGILTGFIIVYTGSRHEIAGTPQAQIVTWHSDDSTAIPALFQEAEKYAAAAGCHHITVIISADDNAMKLGLAAQGFSEECHDFIIKIKEIRCQPDSRFFVERGREEDLESIMQLALLNADSLISPYRRVTMDQAVFHIREMLKGLPCWLKGDRDFAVLVARERGSSSIPGFSLLYLKNDSAGLMVSAVNHTAAASHDAVPESELFERSTVDEITGMPQGCFLFISVARKEWGRAVARHLTAASASLFKESGFDYFSGEMLCRNHNPRARLQRMYGTLFEIEKLQMVKCLT
ncbi:MAG: hypothetical protein AB2L14_36220 [Candidatus Xenobiia bacterium LiM19]